jgi:hypothetical protein
MANVLEYQVTYKYNATDPQQTEVFYTPEQARTFMASVELWGGVAIMVEAMVDENDLTEFKEHKDNG